MFFSLDPPVTKRQILNTICQAKVFFVVVASLKIEDESMAFYIFHLKQHKELQLAFGV